MGSPGTNPPADTEGQLHFGGVKSYMRIFDCAGGQWVPLTSAIFKDQV